jgi:hypothetical protein
MRVGRALALLAMLIAPVAASAQFGGMPGTPGGPPGMPGGFGAAPQPQPPPPACQELLALRDETQKHGMAIQRANERKGTVQEACRLFRLYLSAEVKFMKGIEEHGRTCGVAPDVLKQVKDSHSRASQIGKQVCEAAAQGPRPAGRDRWDVLREGSQKQDQSEDDNCNLCWKTGDFWWLDKRNRLPGSR